jgi:hypothetical protein
METQLFLFLPPFIQSCPSGSCTARVCSEFKFRLRNTASLHFAFHFLDAQFRYIWILELALSAQIYYFMLTVGQLRRFTFFRASCWPGSMNCAQIIQKEFDWNYVHCIEQGPCFACDVNLRINIYFQTSRTVYIYLTIDWNSFTSSKMVKIGRQNSLKSSKTPYIDLNCNEIWTNLDYSSNLMVSIFIWVYS